MAPNSLCSSISTTEAPLRGRRQGRRHPRRTAANHGNVGVAVLVVMVLTVSRNECRCCPGLQHGGLPDGPAAIGPWGDAGLCSRTPPASASATGSESTGSQTVGTAKRFGDLPSYPALWAGYRTGRSVHRRLSTSNWDSCRRRRADRGAGGT